MAWWEQNNLRLIQNNIRDTDANLDVDLLIEKLEDLSANTLQLNTGGLMAFYPTQLEYQYQSPFLKNDLIKEIINKCHEHNIKFIARFDFSKAHYSIFEKHPEWFYKSQEGEFINYNDMVHTCINGYYQKKYSLEIIKEVITKYPVDGIFFNMFGYQTRDYSGNYHGICRCDKCKSRFREMFDLDLPYVENFTDPTYKKYIEFKDITTKELLDDIHALVKGIDKDLPISTYTDLKVDMIRKESNNAVDRPYPLWLYSASENVKSVEDTWDEKTVSNCSINAVDIFYRFQGVSKNQIRVRLYQNIANGSGLDFCINGVFEDYPDRDNFDTVKEVYSFHKRNEKYYGCFGSVSDIALIKPKENVMSKVGKEYLGIFKMLKEQHIIFDVICQENLENRLDDLNNYKCIIVPDYRILNDSTAEYIIEHGINIILTGVYPTNGDEKLFDIIGGSFIKTSLSNRSAYLSVGNKNIFKRFPNRDWVFIDKSFAHIEYNDSNLNLLPFINPARFGPPERCGGYTVSEFKGASVRDYKGKIVSIPWEIGDLYYRYGYEDHKNILFDLLDYTIDKNYILSTNAPLDVEVFLNKYENGDYILQLLNLTGFNGTTYYEPNPVQDINISIHDMDGNFTISCLDDVEPVNFELQNGKLNISIKKLDSFKAFIIKKC